MQSSQLAVSPAQAAAPLTEVLGQHSLAPLWKLYGNLMSAEPKPTCKPALWQYTTVRPLLMRAAEEVSTQEAERRVLLFKNPGLDRPLATHTLGCGLQLIMGGEVEGSHRHTAAALRLVIEGTGAYTATDGERIWMRRGDVITTPSWTWHDHGKESEGPMIWLDGIDVPIVNFLQTTFYEELEGEDPRQPLFRPDGDSTFRYGSGLLPLNAVPTKRYSPVYCYPYERTLEVLDGLNRAQEWDPHHGLKMRLANPLTGGHFLPTIAGFVQQLPKGFSTSPYRATDAAIYTVLQGSGTVTMGSETFAFAENDTFVAPNWTPISFSASDEVVLFSFSDRALQEHMGVYREQPVS